MAINTHAQSGITVAADDRQINLGPSIEWIEDRDNQLTFENVKHLPESAFQPGSHYTFNKGYTSSGYWIRFRLNFPEELINSAWLLEIPFPLLDYVDLYYPNKHDEYSVIQTGDRRPFKQRDLDTTNFVFKLRPQQQNNVYYLHVNTQDSLQVPLFLWHTEHFPKHNAYVSGLQGIYYGIMIVMVLYNLFIYLSVRELSYLYYIGYISTFTVFQASIQGYGFEYFWPNYTTWANINIPFLGVLSLFFASLFARNILNTQSLFPKFDKALILIASSLFLTLPLVLFAPYDIGIIAALCSTFVFFNLVLLTACLAASKNNRTAKVFVIAWSIFLISGVVSLLGAVNILPLEYASQTTLQIGSAIEVTLLSIALADRINLIKQEKAKIETEARQTLIKANIQLANSNRLKDEFIATISHEIRTPMNGILGSAQLLQDTQTSEEQSQFIDTINHSGQTLLDILNNILDYSKIEAEKIQLESVEFDVEEMINECANCFSIIASDKKIKLFVRIHKSTPKRIISDPVRFKQILLNLVSNAFKFTTEGQITIHVQCVKNRPDQIYIEVKDSGCGLTPEQQSILFQPFVQVDGSSSRSEGGTGLGLAISKKLTHLMHGDIGVNSSLNNGSTFWFTATVTVVEDAKKPAFIYDKKVAVFMSNQYQETLIKEQLKEWNITIINCTPFTTRDNMIIISDQGSLPKVLALGIAEQHVILIADNHAILSDATHKITSPITPQKIRHALSTSDSLTFITKHKRPKEAVTHLDFSRLKVLAVDDNSVNRMILKKMLEKYKVIPDMANDGLEAIDLICKQQKCYDLILMDIEMPIKDGYQTTLDIRDFEKNNNMPASKIVAVSAHSMKESHNKALMSGMDDFLSKPIDQKILIDILTNS